MKEESSKIVKIMRSLGFSHEANAEAQEWFSSSNRSIGSYHKKNSKKPGSGLTFAEEELLMPTVVNLPMTDRDFRKSVDMFFTEITTKVPHEGKILEVGLRDNDKPLGFKFEDGSINYPLEIEDYISYRHAISHPQVALNEFEAEGNQIILFYIKDTKVTSDKNKEDNDIKDKAMAIYLNSKNDSQKVEKLLINMGVEVRNISEADRVLELKKKIESGIAGSKLFIEVAEDKDLDTKWRINKLIQAKILNKVGSRILITEGGTEIGRDMKEAILWWNDDTKSEEVNTLKARYKELSIK